MSQIRLSASSLYDFQTCPQKYRLKHIVRIVPDRDTDALRTGTNWHALHEVHSAGGMEAVLAKLNSAYESRPSYKTEEEWGTERELLLRSFLCYLDYWKDDPMEVVANEQKFELPLIHPRLKLPLPEKDVVVTGRIDQIVKWGGRVRVLERKSTSSDIAPDSDYWPLWRKNPQATMYSYAARYSASFEEHAGCTLIDVWRKPRHKLCKGETIEGYGDRVQEAIAKAPETYFARQEIARTEAEIDAFENELYKVYKAIAAYTREDCWWENTHSCRNPFVCEFVPVCYGPGADSVDAARPPAGFTSLTVRGKSV